MSFKYEIPRQGSIRSKYKSNSLEEKVQNIEENLGRSIKSLIVNK